jgi:hypothetical protein
VNNRGNREDHDELERLGNRGWGWDHIPPIHKAVEDNQSGASSTRGVGGPPHISQLRFQISSASTSSMPRRGQPVLKRPNLHLATDT